jgi:hypothetical protein
VSSHNEWSKHVQPMKARIHELATSPEPERAAYYADGAIDALAYLLAEVDFPVPTPDHPAVIKG